VYRVSPEISDHTSQKYPMYYDDITRHKTAVSRMTEKIDRCQIPEILAPTRPANAQTELRSVNETTKRRCLVYVCRMSS